MSIMVRALLCSIFLILAGYSAVFAMDAARVKFLTVEVADKANPDAKVSVTFQSPVRSFSFPTEHAGVKGLDRRISGLRTFDSGGNIIPHRTAEGGAIFSDFEIAMLGYSVDLSTPSDPFGGAHVSWFASGGGILMLFDLIPFNPSPSGFTELELRVPEGFGVDSLHRENSAGVYRIAEIEDAVFMVTRSARKLEAEAGDTNAGIAIGGDWQFSDKDLKAMTAELLSRYRKLFGTVPFKRVQVMVMPVPDPEMRDRWRAETRGPNVLILSSPSTYRNLGEQRISEQLRHELLHLWIPNSLSIRGDYAWFYEGFIFYRALLTGVELRQIRFEDVLATIEDALRREARAGDWAPLVTDMSERRGSGIEYSRGMLAAFAADVLLNRKSGDSVDDLLRKVFRKGSKEDAAGDGSEFVIGIMKEWSELVPLVDSSIAGRKRPDWGSVLSSAGLDAQRLGQRGSLKALADPDSRQKAFLRRLGYNTER